MVDFNSIGKYYVTTHEKPDKKYSMIPTALSMLNPIDGKRVIDVGTGDGLFAKIFAKEALSVFAFDNAESLISMTDSSSVSNITYKRANMHEINYPKSDIIFAPYVLNYVEPGTLLLDLFTKFYSSLVTGGTLGSIVDMPKETFHDGKKFGSQKRMTRLEDNQEINIELYNNEKFITAFNSYYRSKETFENLLYLAGFSEVNWIRPIISDEGFEKFGEDFWIGYVDNPGVAYFVAKK